MNFAFSLALLLSSPGAFAQEPGRCGDRIPAPRLENYPPVTRNALDEAYRHAIENCTNAKRLGQMAMLAHALEEHELAATYYRLIAPLEPEDFRWPYLGGLALWRAGEQQEAVEHLARAAKLAPDFLPVRLSLGEFLLELGDLSLALASFEEALRRDPENAEALYGSARVLVGLGRGAEAESRLRSAVKTFPEFGPALYSLALLLRDSGKPEESRQLLQQYGRHSNRWPVREDPVLEEVHLLKSQPADYLRTGVRMAEAGQTQEAIRLHLEAIDRDPSLAQAHVNLIQLFASIGELEQAVEHYQKALEIQPDQYDAHFNYGVLQIQLGNFQEAAAAFSGVLEINPHHSGALNNLGTIRMNEGRLEEAADRFRLALSNAPEHQGARFNYSRVLAAQGRLDEAVEQMETLHRRLEPGSREEARYAYALGALLVRKGDLPRGREMLEKAGELAAGMEDGELLASIERDLRSLQQMMNGESGNP